MTLRIKEIAKAKGIRLEDIANDMGIRQESLSRSINNNPTLDTLEKIAKSLDVHVAELFEADNVNAEQIYKKVDGQYIQIGTLNK